MRPASRSPRPTPGGGSMAGASRRRWRGSAALTRTRVGPFPLADAVAPEAVTPAALRDPAALVADLPRQELDEAGRAAVIHGRPVMAGKGEGGRVALFSNGELVAVAERVADALKPRGVGAEA